MASFLSHLNIAAHRIYSPAFCIWHNVVRNLQSPYLAMAQKIGGSACLLHSLTAAVLSPCHTTNLSHEIGVCDKSSRIRKGRKRDREGGVRQSAVD